MRYFLKNIAQNSMLRTITLIVLGVAMWTFSFFQQENIISLISTLLLTIFNALLITQYFYKGKETNLPSPFVGTTYWFAMSAIPMLHTCWQAQLTMIGVWLVMLTLLKTDFHHEATEESFLATLICCFLAPLESVFLSGIIYIWGYLIIKQQMTWRVWFASLIAVAVHAISMFCLHYFGWLEGIWLENLPRLSWQEWLIWCGTFILTLLMILLPLRKPSTASGIMYVIFFIVLVAAGVLTTFNPLPIL